MTVDQDFVEDENTACDFASSSLYEDGLGDSKWEHIDNEPFDAIREEDAYKVKLRVSCYYRDIIEAQDYDEMIEKLQQLVENNSIGLEIEWDSDYEEELEYGLFTKPFRQGTKKRYRKS